MDPLKNAHPLPLVETRNDHQSLVYNQTAIIVLITAQTAALDPIRQVRELLQLES